MGGIVSGVGNAVAGYTTGIQDEKQADLIRKLGSSQMQLDQWAAGQTRDQGVQAAEQSLVKGGQTIGAAQTAYATSGVDGQSGSAAGALEDSRMFSSLDARTTLNNASRQAWGYEAKGAMDFANAQEKGQELEDQGQTALTKGLFGLFSAGASFASMSGGD